MTHLEMKKKPMRKIFHPNVNLDWVEVQFNLFQILECSVLSHFEGGKSQQELLFEKCKQEIDAEERYNILQGKCSLLMNVLRSTASKIKTILHS